MSIFLWLAMLIQHFQRSLQHENLVRLLGLVIEEGKGGTVKSKIFLVKLMFKKKNSFVFYANKTFYSKSFKEKKTVLLVKFLIKKGSTSA